MGEMIACGVQLPKGELGDKIKGTEFIAGAVQEDCTGREN